MIKKLGHKALLIYPEFDTQDTFWSYAHSLKRYAPLGEFGLPKRLLPPLGLMGLFNHLKPYYKELLLVDRNIDPRPLSLFLENVDHVYLGGMLAQESSMVNIALEIKKAGKLLIVGGTAITADSPLVQIADCCVENEAEAIINELLLDIANHSLKKYYKSAITLTEQFFQPDFSAINLDNYVHMAIQISRGCPEKCEFCDIPIRFGKAFRVTPWEKTAQSFQQLKELEWMGQVFIVDDNFIGHPKKALENLKKLYEIGESIGYHHPKYTELTLRLADDSPIMSELRLWFRKTHFINGFYGVETPNKASLLETHKKQNLRGEKTLVEKLKFISQETGAGVMMGMIYGFDHDTTDSINEFIEFVNATNSPIVMAGLLNALPCTPLMTRLTQQERIIQASSGNNSDGIINFIPHHFSVQQAEQNYLKILDSIYQPSAFFDRVFRHLELIDPDLQDNFRVENKAFGYVIKILSKKYALIYWRYLPIAFAIAKRRCGFNTSGYYVILAEFFSLCGQFTHFKLQINEQRKKITVRHYTVRQTQSWQQLLESKHPQSETIK